MMDYINENNILSDDQFGFRRGRNCEQMLSNFFHVLSKLLDNRNYNLIDGVFLDFSSAFDKVDHNLLLRKLHSLGFRGSHLEWIQNFLLMRRQRVIFKGSLSEWCKVTSGVPQGCVLGPILFLLFVNDINDVVSSQLLQFADDHSIVRPICNEHDHNILQQDIQNIFQWTVLNKLPLDLSKCTVMHMTRSKSPNLCSPYFMGTVRLEEVDNFKLLDVTFSKDLSFDSQVGTVSDKISKLSGFIIRCTKNMSSLHFLISTSLSFYLTLCIVSAFGLLFKEIILIGWRRSEEKLLAFHFIEGLPVMLTVGRTILKGLLNYTWWSWRMYLSFLGWSLVTNF